MENPRFSVIIPTLNEEKFLPLLLGSLASQTTRDFEVIVVDGASKDKTVKVAKSFESKLPSLTVVTCDPPSLPKQRNDGARVARGEWLLFIDADTVLRPYFFAQFDEYLRRVKPQYVTAWYSPDSEVTGDALITLLVNISMEMGTIIHRPVAYGPLSMITKTTFEAVGGYDESRKFGEDSDFTARVHEKGIKLHIMRETVSIYSMRRFRKQGTIKTLQIYAKAAFMVLMTKRTQNEMPGYIMGGHLYTAKDPKKSRSLIRQFDRSLKKFMKEFFPEF